MMEISTNRLADQTPRYPRCIGDTRKMKLRSDRSQGPLMIYEVEIEWSLRLWWEFRRKPEKYAINQAETQNQISSAHPDIKSDR